MHLPGGGNKGECQFWTRDLVKQEYCFVKGHARNAKTGKINEVAGASSSY